MAKTTKKRTPNTLVESAGKNVPAARVEWGNVEFEGYAIEQEISFSPWKPEPGERRVFTLMGWEFREGATGAYIVYSGRDEKTGETFTFIGGGQFDWIVKERNIVAGNLLGVEYRGLLPARPSSKNPRGIGEYKNWNVYILKPAS